MSRIYTVHAENGNVVAKCFILWTHLEAEPQGTRSLEPAGKSPIRYFRVGRSTHSTGLGSLDPTRNIIVEWANPLRF